MKQRLASLVCVAALVVLGATPVAAGSAWVDRVTGVDTVLAVRVGDDFPLASLMRASCDWAQFVRRPDGSGVETLDCVLSSVPVMIPAFQGEPPAKAFRHAGGSCEWTSDYWFTRDQSIVMAESFSYVVTPSGRVNIRADYPANPLTCT